MRVIVPVYRLACGTGTSLSTLVFTHSWVALQELRNSTGVKQTRVSSVWRNAGNPGIVFDAGER